MRYIGSGLERKYYPPTDEVAGFSVRPGKFLENGAIRVDEGVNFTIHSNGAKSCSLCLFHVGEHEPYAVIPFPDSCRMGDTYSMVVYGLKPREFEYAYQFDGEYNVSKGLLFDKTKYILDPYARSVAGQEIWGKEKPVSERIYKARVVDGGYDWGNFKNTSLEPKDLIIYEMHVRGFTQDKSSGVEHRGTYEGIREKIPYLLELGINAVELMPVFEFDETEDVRIVDGEKLINYWGYSPVCFFAPNVAYASDTRAGKAGNEFRSLIHELNANGIEVILDVVFNHTAEGNEMGPCFSFKGIDNNIYYMLTPDGHYYNFSGCGNTLNCNHPIVHQMILECLRYWTTAYHVDGFRFDLATILGRNEDGSPMSKPPLLQSLAFDPILGSVKLIAEAWDAGGLYQVGTFPSWNRWAEWNGRYRDDLRNFLKGDYGMWGIAAQRITGSRDIYNPKNRANASVNFLTCHDGFTLWDLYSYNQKHNEANGWNNTDGSDDNRSWNCGVEGETDNEEVLALRRRLAMNAFAVLMCSRGTPMYFSGDEFLNTQYGNNNSYCQDNEISWLNWGDLEKNREHFEFCKYMIAFRKAHPVLRKFSGNSWCGFPEIQVLGPDDATKVLRVIYAGRVEVDSRGNGHDDIVCLAVNVFWEDQEFWLPELPGGKVWYVAADTSGRYLKDHIPGQQGMMRLPENRVTVGARSVCVFIT